MYASLNRVYQTVSLSPFKLLFNLEGSMAKQGLHGYYNRFSLLYA